MGVLNHAAADTAGVLNVRRMAVVKRAWCEATRRSAPRVNGGWVYKAIRGYGQGLTIVQLLRIYIYSIGQCS